MPGLALALWGVALIFAFGLRVLLHYRATGSSGILLPTERPFTLPWLGAVGFEGSLVVMVAGSLWDATGGPGPVGLLDSEPLRIAGTIAALGGIAGVVGAQAAMGRQWRIGVAPGQATELVTGGPFAYVRNPIYTAMFVGFGGIVLTDPTPVALAGYALLVAGIQIQVRQVEEAYLRHAHGEEYGSYAARVGRFLPGIGKGTGGGLEAS